MYSKQFLFWTHRNMPLVWRLGADFTIPKGHLELPSLSESVLRVEMVPWTQWRCGQERSDSQQMWGQERDTGFKRRDRVAIQSQVCCFWGVWGWHSSKQKNLRGGGSEEDPWLDLQHTHPKTRSWTKSALPWTTQNFGYRANYSPSVFQDRHLREAAAMSGSYNLVKNRLRWLSMVTWVQPHGLLW